MNKNIISGIAIFIILGLGGYYFLNQEQYLGNNMNSKQDSGAGGYEETVLAGSEAQVCTDQGGTWYEENRECLSITGEVCREIGGAFDECASPCRHNPEADVCTTVCVPVCYF